MQRGRSRKLKTKEKGDRIQAVLRNILPILRLRILRNGRKKKILTFITAFANHLMERVKEAFIDTPPPKNSSTQSAKLFMHACLTPQLSGAK